MKLRSGGGAALSSVGHHAEILRGGPEAWNAWRKKRPSTIPHLTGVVLAASERELGGESGTPINLKSARLKEAVFRFATLSAANLQAADLAHADLVHARLIHANLSEATLQSAALDHADFSGAVLLHADLRGASLRFATLAGADLKGADLSGADLAHARLAHTNLAGANLRRAVLDYADFAGADLSQTDLSGARLDNVRNLLTSQLEESLGDSATILPSHLRGCVPWSAIGGETPVPLLNPAEFWLLQARRDLRRQTFYGQTVRVAGVLVVGAAVATGLVTETAHDTLPGAPAEAKKSVEPTLSVLPAMDEQASALSMPAATRLEAAVPPPSLATIPADLVRPAAPAQSAIVEPADAPVPSEAADPPSETISQVVGAVALRVTQEAEDRLETSATKEELPASEFSTVFNLPAAAPVTLTLASTTLSPLKAGQSAVAALRTRMPKIPTLVRASLRPKVVKQARAIMPVVAAFDDPKTPAPAAAAAVPEPMMLVVSLDAQKLDIYRGIKHVASAKISSGMPGYDTKLGVFSILEKKRRHHSNLYSGAPMPFMQRLTRSGTALHAGAIPGYPASHGCVRLPYSFAPKLFEMTSVGQNVVVTRGRPVPTRIEHPNLFELPPPKPPVAMAASVAVPRLLTDAVAVSTESDDDDHAIAAFHSDAPLRMLVTRRTAHDRVMAVQYMLADLGYLARQNFIGNLGPATGNAIRAFQKANGLPVTGAFTDELVRQVYRAAGKTEPPEGYLFVRQGFKRVFDLPISFRDPAVSLGTHVFTVVKRGDAAKPEWMAVSLEGGDAASVLDRIAIPDDVRRPIAPRLTPGSTLIVADKSEYSAILPEGDDFLVSTAEQAAAEDAKVEHASVGLDDVEPAKAKVAKKRAARAAQVARTRSYDKPRREIRRRYIRKPSPFGMPYFFGR